MQLKSVVVTVINTFINDGFIGLFNKIYVRIFKPPLFIDGDKDKIRVENIEDMDRIIKETQNVFIQKNNILVILHLYYPELFDELYSQLEHIKEFDLMVSIGPNVTMDDLTKIIDKKKNVAFFRFDNIGRDIAPFFKIVNFARSFTYDYILKIHTKKSPHRIDGNFWRSSILYSLIGSENIVKDNLSLLEKSFYLVAPHNHLLSVDRCWGNNKQLFDNLIGSKEYKNFLFPAGSMYFASFPAICRLFDELESKNLVFEAECGQIDGTLAHVLERYIGYFFENNNLKMTESNSHKKKFIRFFNVRYLCNLFSSVLRDRI